MPRAERCNAVYHHSLRWSVEHTDENRLKLMVFLRKNTQHFIFQAEDTVDNPHYQGYIHTVKKVRSKQLAREWNSEFLGVEIRPCSNEGQSALKKYAMKEDTRVAGPWADRKIYLGADLWAADDPRRPAWQHSMDKLLAAEPGDRLMFWVYDPEGNSGKTKYIKTLAYRHGALPLAYGHSGDILNLVYKNQGKRVYAWNLTRTKPAQLSEQDLYAAMESIKDGMFINTKYETGLCLMDPPHVLVFANHVPKMHQISADRWKLFTISDNELIPL